MKKFLPLLLASLLMIGLCAGCRRGIQSDLKILDTHFGGTEGSKNRFYGKLENTGNRTYSTVFIVVDLYENEDFAKRLETSANLIGSNKLQPGGTATFDKDFDDGGFKPNRYELVRLYGIE